jgi:hypothetical protein
VRLPLTAAAGLVGVLAFATAACSGGDSPTQTPGLAPRGTVMTTAKPARQDLTSTVSLAGKVTVDPVFGLVAPVAGQVRYAAVTLPTGTPTRPTRVATVYAKGKSYKVEVPAGAVFAGRLVEDRATVPAGMPIVSARKVGYGIVADIDGASAYKISANLTSVRAQIDDGPGPFSCKVLGTIAALPAGTIPDPPVQSPQPSSSGPPVVQEPAPNGPPPSEPTGMRIVCLAPSSVRLINGAAVRLEIVTAQATGVLVLPVEAVAGGQGKGLVDVVRPDGTKETREVVLGMTDGRVIEIRSGLTEAETVAVPGPDIAAVPPDQVGNNPGGGVVVKK